MFWPLMLTILIVLMNVPLYFFDQKAGICVSVFAAVYFVVMLGIFMANKSAVRNEVISFATQYGTVQKKLLNEFEIPYAAGLQQQDFVDERGIFQNYGEGQGLP